MNSKSLDIKNSNKIFLLISSIKQISELKILFFVSDKDFSFFLFINFFALNTRL